MQTDPDTDTDTNTHAHAHAHAHTPHSSESDTSPAFLALLRRRKLPFCYFFCKFVFTFLAIPNAANSHAVVFNV
jgi:hypothetical protein